MREVPEWIGATDDGAIPTRVRLRVWERCGGKCAITGRKLRPGDPWELDHITPLIMGGAHSEANLQVVSVDGHKIKTKLDVAAKAKADRVKARHLGIKTKRSGLSKHPTLVRGFDGRVRERTR